jgi:molybdopterin/thiamine biosynthesis adenylyltransferase
MIDISKHQKVFDPKDFKGYIGVVGVGALGSALALNLAKLGLGDRMVLYDFDKVEGHNLANQVLYGDGDIGHYKAEVAADVIAVLTDGTKPRASTYEVDNRADTSHITHLFMCVDTMAARKTIFTNCVYMQPNKTYVADGRMSARGGLIYGFNPSNLPKAKEYLKRWYPDEDVPVETSGGCSITTSVGATAAMVAAQMTWQFINHHTGFIKVDGKSIPPYEEIAFQVDDLDVHAKGYL